MTINADTKTQRIPWIDVARGIAIILIIIGHCSGIPLTLRNLIFSFHVPAFFILSGYVYRKKNNNKITILKDIKHLISPYIITVILILLLKLISNAIYDFDSLKRFVHSALFGYGSTYENIQLIGAIWFLLAMFFARRLMDFIFDFTNDIKIQSLIAILFLIMGFSLSKYHFIPMNIDVAFVAVGYMYAGYLLKYFSLKFNITTLIVMLMIWYSAYSCSTLSMSKRFYGIYYLNFLGAIAGSIILFYIAIYLSKINAIQKSLSFFGKHTIVILCIHDLDWRLPFPLWQPYLRPYLNTPLYFPLTVICRFSFDIVLAILFVLISKLIFDYYNRIRKFKLS